MAIKVCPTDIVEASPERVWGHLVNAEAIARWSEMSVREAPRRELVVGDRLVLVGRRGLTLRIEIREIEPLTRIAMEVGVPFGVVNHEVIQIRPLPGGHCRVTLNCNFEFRSGFRGYLTEKLLGPKLSGTAEHLANLKRAAETSAAPLAARATLSGATVVAAH